MLYLFATSILFKMNTFQIKTIALISMLIDHIGLMFFSSIIAFRIIGRLAFPLFAWLIANGAYHTKNINKYTIRIFVLALVSQLPYMFAFGYDLQNFSLNIFFTLFAGLVCIKIYQKHGFNIFTGFIYFFIIFIAEVFKFDYGAYGVLSIFLFYIFFNNFKKTVISQIILLYIFYFFEPILNIINFSYYKLSDFVQIFGLISLIFIYFYNKKSGPKMKIFFYSFYPVHLVILGLIFILLF